MSATALTPQQSNRDGVALSFTAVDNANGNEFLNTGRELVLLARSGAGGAGTTTVVTQQTVDGQAVADKSLSIADDTTVVVGPFPPSIYNDANGKVQLTHDDADSDIAVIRS